MKSPSDLSLFCALFNIFGFCLNINFAQMSKIEFVEGYVGGTCKKTPDCIGPVEKVCLVGICNCGNGFKPFEVAGTKLVGCFALEEIPCVEGVNIAVPEYFTNKELWDAHFENATRVAKENPVNEDLQHHVDALKKIAESGMNGKSDLDWSCQSGSCTAENKCAPGPPHGALNRVKLPTNPPNETESRGQLQTSPGSYHIVIICIGLMFIFAGAQRFICNY